MAYGGSSTLLFVYKVDTLAFCTSLFTLISPIVLSHYTNLPPHHIVEVQTHIYQHGRQTVQFSGASASEAPSAGAQEAHCMLRWHLAGPR